MRGERGRGRHFLDAFVFLLLRFELLTGCYCCLEVWWGGVLVVFWGLEGEGNGEGDGEGEGEGEGRWGDGPVWSFW